MVHHTNSDVLVLAMESVMKSTPSQVKMLCRFYYKTDAFRRTIKIRKEVKQKIVEMAKKMKTTTNGFVDAIMTIFFRATLATLWKSSQHKYVELVQKYSDYILRKDLRELKVKQINPPEVKRRKLKYKKDGNEMRHHNYTAEFNAYMEKFGGMQNWLNKNIYLMIHAMPLKGNVGKATEMDAVKEDNPGTVHIVRLWKRGRGYNLTIFGHGDSYGEDAPELEIGTVYRLYDIYRNIDWLTIKTV
jgi:hypothetical protein